MNQLPMNVGLYSGAAGMRMGEDYQNLISENLSLQSVPGFKQSIATFSTDPQAITNKTQQSTNSGNPAAVVMNRVIDFSQGPVHALRQSLPRRDRGQGLLHQVREADGTTSYTRNGSFSVSPRGELHDLRRRHRPGQGRLGRQGRRQQGQHVHDRFRRRDLAGRHSERQRSVSPTSPMPPPRCRPARLAASPPPSRVRRQAGPRQERRRFPEQPGRKQRQPGHANGRHDPGRARL